MQAPSRQVLVGHSSAYPTCHNHHPFLESHDLVVGLSSGDGKGPPAYRIADGVFITDELVL